MKQIFILAFILLATLSSSYADCSNFLCPSTASTFSLKFTPNPIVNGLKLSVTVTGILASDVPPGCIFNFGYFDIDNGNMLNGDSANFCSSSGIICPIPSGQAFSTSIDFTAPDNLPSSPIVVKGSIIDPRAITNPIVGCSFTSVEAGS